MLSTCSERHMTLMWCRAAHNSLHRYLSTSWQHKGTVGLFTQWASYERRVVITPVQCVRLTYLRVNCAVETGASLGLRVFKGSLCLNDYVFVVEEPRKAAV